MARLRLHLITWNVANKAVLEPKKINELLQLDAINNTDIFVIGFQEIITGALETAKSFVVYDEWTVALKEVVSKHDFFMVENVRMQGMSLCVFSKTQHLPFIRFIKTDMKRTGLGGNWGNKGGVSVSCCIHGTRVCFLNTHLAAHHDNTIDRIENFKEIHSEIDFGGDSSIQSHDVAFWIGDTNFRINKYSKEEIIDLVEKGEYENLIEYDQLKDVQKTNELLGSYIESKINFPPTYKFDPGTDVYDTSEKQRKPAWTDRVLCHIHPDYPSLSQYVQKSLQVQDTVNEQSLIEADHGSYINHMQFKISDHKPVSQKFIHNVPKPQTQLISLKISEPWKGEGKVEITYHQGMLTSSNDYLALYEDPVKDIRDYKNWIYVVDYKINPKEEITTQECFPEIEDPKGQYRIGYCSDKMSCMLALSDRFTVV